MKIQSKHTETRFWQALLPVLFTVFFLVYGTMLRPVVLGLKPVSLEIIFLFSSVFAATQLMLMGYKWDDIFKSLTDKIAKAFPTLLILLAIGMIIGSWIACGTIPMFVYYGIKLINPDYLYLIAFLVPIVFSTITGTSWGSVSTVGIVLMGIAISLQADISLAAAAIIGGSFFGDKLSPLSDTTNIAAVATDVGVYDHIRSMLYTTIPAAIFAALFYLVAGFVFPVTVSVPNETSKILALDSPGVVNIEQTLTQIEHAFNFNLLLLMPPVVVLWGSFKRYPSLPVLLISSMLAMILALCFQSFTFSEVSASLITGFDTTMIDNVKTGRLVTDLFTRGGLYSLKEPFIISVFVFAYVGIIGRIDAMTVIVKRLFGWISSVGGTVRATLISSAVVNSMTSNQYANSFIVGDAFKKKFDELKIPRYILSRSLEDTGTMLESLVPWHTTALFMATTLGVAVADYWYLQVFSLSNIVLAFVLTFFLRFGNGRMKRKVN